MSYPVPTLRELPQHNSSAPHHHPTLEGLARAPLKNDYVHSIFIYHKRLRDREIQDQYLLYINGKDPEEVSVELLPQLRAIDKALAESHARCTAELSLIFETRRDRTSERVDDVVISVGVYLQYK